MQERKGTVMHNNIIIINNIILHIIINKTKNKTNHFPAFAFQFFVIIIYYNYYLDRIDPSNIYNMMLSSRCFKGKRVRQNSVEFGTPCSWIFIHSCRSIECLVIGQNSGTGRTLYKTFQR